MKHKKRILSIILSILMIFNFCGMDRPVYATEMEDLGIATDTDAEIQEDDLDSDVEEVNELQVESDNSFGDLFADIVNEEAESQQLDYYISSVEVENDTLTATFSTIEDCSIIIGIYSEESSEGSDYMLASFISEVSPDYSVMKLDISDESFVTEYYYIRAFLVDTSSKAPLSDMYESSMYTKSMQELKSKTIDDFDSDQVLNLDESDENNFAVYSDYVKHIPDFNGSTNNLIERDSDARKYVFENPDDAILSCQNGEIISYDFGDDDDLLLTKIESVEYDAQTDVAVIYGAPIEMGDVFDYVKVDLGSVTDQFDITPVEEDGITYEGVSDTGTEEYENDTQNVAVQVTTYDGLNENSQTVYGGLFSLAAIDTSANLAASATFKFLNKEFGSEDNNVSINGQVDFSFACTLKIYLALNEQYVELKNVTSLKFKGSVDGTITAKIPLAKAKTPKIIKGVQFSTEFGFELSTSGSFEGTVSVVVESGVNASLNGIKNMATKPKVTAESKASVTIFAGPVFSIKCKVISGDYVTASLRMAAGGEIELATNGNNGKYEPNDYSVTSKHECKRCMTGNIKTKFEFTVTCKVQPIKFLNFTVPFSLENTIGSMYYSIDHNKFGFGECPYKTYLVTLQVNDENGDPINGLKIDGKTTDKKGCIYQYLSNGKKTFTIYKTGYKTVNKTVVVKNKSYFVTVKLKKNTELKSQEYDKFDEVGRVVIQEDIQNMSGDSEYEYSYDSKYIYPGAEYTVTADEKLIEEGAVPDKMSVTGTGTCGTQYVHITYTAPDSVFKKYYNNYNGHGGEAAFVSYLGYRVSVYDEYGNIKNAKIERECEMSEAEYVYEHTESGYTFDNPYIQSGIELDCKEGIVPQSSSYDKYGNSMGKIWNITTDSQNSNPLDIYMDNKLIAKIYSVKGNGNIYSYSDSFVISPNYFDINVIDSDYEVDIDYTIKNDIYVGYYEPYVTDYIIDVTVRKKPDDLNVTGTSFASAQSTQLDDYAAFEEKYYVIDDNTITYYNCKPNDVYNFYIVKSSNEGNFDLTRDNLNYAIQIKANESGIVKIMRKHFDFNPVYHDWFLIGRYETDIQNAEVASNILPYRGYEQKLDFDLVMNGVVLEREKDYVVSEPSYASNPGEYEIEITGIGRYRGNKTISCIIDSSLAPQKITMSQLKLQMTVGDSQRIYAKTDLNQDDEPEQFKWSSSDNSIASVSENGTINAKSKGTVKIRATLYTDETIYAECTVEIAEKKESPQEPQQEEPPSISVSYRTHIQTFGWEGKDNDIKTWKSNGKMSGTSGLAKRLEGINIVVNPAENGKKVDLGIQYTTHCQSYGWLPWSANGEMNGTEGEAKRLEAIKIQLIGADKDKYDVYYRVHAQSYGWLGWAKNGAPSGTAGYAKRLEGIQVVVVKKGASAPGLNYAGVNAASGVHQTASYIAKAGSSPIVGSPATSNLNPCVPGETNVNVAYRTHVQTYGWQGWKYNGQMSGTSGQAKRLEGINIKLTNKQYSGSIVYTTHVQTYGWQGKENDPNTWKRDGEMSGTSGEAKRLEAIRIALTGEMAKHYDIYYRVHAQSYGWLNWAKNGEAAGTAGLAKRLEGIQIVLVPKGGNAPARSYQGITSVKTQAYIKK